LKKQQLKPQKKLPMPRQHVPRRDRRLLREVITLKSLVLLSLKKRKSLKTFLLTALFSKRKRMERLFPQLIDSS